MQLKIPLIVFTIIIISAILFLIPNSLQKFAFSGQYLFNGEFWRLVTFNFTHINFIHLIENIIALVVAALLAYELDLRGNYFIIAFLLSAVTIALAEAMFFPLIIIAGASLGIYAILGSVSVKGSNFFPRSALIIMFVASIFLGYVINLITCTDCVNKNIFIQSIFHFFGLLAGMLTFYFYLQYQKSTKKSLLSVENG